MLFFPDPGNGVLASLDMVERAEEEGLPPARAGYTPVRWSSRKATTSGGR